MTLRIEPFEEEDYPDLARVRTAVDPEYPVSPRECRREDEHRPPQCHWERWIGRVDGRVVACGEYSHSPYWFHPRKFDVNVRVEPEYQGLGHGKALYHQILRALERHEPILVSAEVREDHPRASRFLQERGFTERMRSWESRLDLATFDPSPFAESEERVAREGIEIRSIRELEGDPGRNRKLFELDDELSRDVPSPDPFTGISYEQWAKIQFENPNMLPDGWFIALDGEKYVGFCQLWGSEGGPMLYNGLTGVTRDYRRRGIALGLKLRGIRWAQEQGRPEIRTWNASTNEGMLSINVRLGFARQPAWVQYEKRFRPDEDGGS